MIYRKKEGIVLIIVILILLLITFISVIFLNLAKEGEKSVINFLFKRKSFFLSESGYQYAVVKLLDDLKKGNLLFDKNKRYEHIGMNLDWQYMGEDINKDAIMEPGEDTNKNGVLDTIEFPLESDGAVSYQYKGGAISTSDKEKGNPFFSYALTSGETYHIFKLKITDEAGKININYGDLQNRNSPSNEKLKRILNILGNEINIPSLGDRIINARSEKGFKNLEELINNPLTYEEYKKVKYYLTIASYGINLPISIGIEGRNKHLKEDNPVYSINELFPKKVESEIRYFININTAPLPVLVAVLTDLQGYYLDSTSMSRYIDSSFAYNKNNIREKKYQSVPLGIIKKTKPISLEQAREIAKRIIQRRLKLPFTNFYGKDGWDAFTEELYSSNIIDFYQKEVLKANFNPNVNSYLWNPDPPLRYLVDKFSLIHSSFEWIFLPAGYFTIESIGEIFSKNILHGRTYTSRLVKLWDVIFLSTEKDFAGEKFNYFAEIFDKADSKFPTRLGYTLDIYPFPYPIEKKANDFVGYIGLSTISLPYKTVMLKYKKKDKESEVPAAIKLSFNEGYKSDDKASEELLKSYEDLPLIFTDGAYSDTFRTIRLSSSKTPLFDTEEVDVNKPKPSTPSGGYPIPVSIAVYKGNLTIMSEQLLGFLDEVKLDPSAMFTGMALAGLAGINPQELRHKKITLFLPHSCCFWDIYWEGGSVHFFVPEHTEELIEKYFPQDVKEAIVDLCNSEQIISIFGGILGSRGLECPLYNGARQWGMGVFFWHKGNWFNKERAYPLFSYGRFFNEYIYGSNKSANKAEPLPDEQQRTLDQIINEYKKKSRYHSAMVQDFFFLYSFIDKEKLMKKEKFTIYLDFSTPAKNIIKDEKNPNNYDYHYLGSYSIAEKPIKIEEGKWSHLGFFVSVDFTPKKRKKPTTAPRESEEEEKPATIVLTSKFFKDEEKKDKEFGIIPKIKYLMGTLGRLEEKDDLSINHIILLEHPGSYVNPGYRFGEYVKRSYAKLDKPQYDPYLYGFVSSQSTYDEIYIFHFEKEAIESGQPEKVAQLLYKAGRYYPNQATYTLPKKLLSNIPQEQNLILTTLYHYIPTELEKKCSVEVFINEKGKFPTQKEGNNIFHFNTYAVGRINNISFHFNCSTPPPLLETPIIDTIILFTSSGTQEIVSSKEIKDISY